MSILKPIYRSNALFIKIPMAFFAEKETSILKFTWDPEGPEIAKIIFKKKNRLEELHFLISKYIIKLW